MGLSASSQTLAVGTASGMLFVRQKKEPKSEEDIEKPQNVLDTTTPKKAKQLRPNNFRYFLRGRSEQASVSKFQFRFFTCGYVSVLMQRTSAIRNGCSGSTTVSY